MALDAQNMLFNRMQGFAPAPARNLDAGRMNAPAPMAGAPAPAGWKPLAPASATRPVDVSAALSGYLSGGGGGGGGGGGMPMTMLGAGNYWHNWQTQNKGWNDNAGGPSGGGGGGTPFQGSDGNWYVSTGFGRRQVPAPGGGGGSPLAALVSEYQRAQNEAVQANEDRYNNINEGYTARRDNALGRLENVGDQQRRDLATDYNAQNENIKASLIDSGMLGSTNLQTLQAGNMRNQTADRNRLESALNREYIGYDTGLMGDQLQFMERRQDTYPDLGQLAQLAQMLGVSTGGGGYGGGGGGLAGVEGYSIPTGQGAFQPMQTGLVQNQMAGWNMPRPLGAGGGGGLNAYQQQLLQHNLAGGRAWDAQRLADYNAWRAANPPDPSSLNFNLVGW